MPATAQIILLKRYLSASIRERGLIMNSLVQDVQLLSRGILFEELAGDFSFGGEDNAILRKYPESCTGV